MFGRMELLKDGVTNGMVTAERDAPRLVGPLRGR